MNNDLEAAGRIRPTATMRHADCLDYGDADCSGPVERRVPSGSTGRAYPRCNNHWLQERARRNSKGRNAR
jgi:hypothetical protein